MRTSPLSNGVADSGVDILGRWVERSKNNSLLNVSYDAYYGAGGRIGFQFFGEKAFGGVHLYTVKQSLVTEYPFETETHYSGLEFGVGPVSLSWIHNWDYTGSDFGFSIGQFKWGAHADPAFEMIGGSLYLLGGVGGNLDLDLGKFIYIASPAAIPQAEKAIPWPSDIKLKRKIVPLENSLDNLTKLSGYNYVWRENAKTLGFQGRDIGLLAQEVELIYPEMVCTDSITGYKKVYYHKLIPVLIDAIKEQQQKIDIQDQLIIEYQTRIGKNENLIEEIMRKLESK